MQQSEIKRVKDHLALIKVPVATINYVQEGTPTPVKDSGEVTKLLRDNWEQGTLEANESFYLLLMNRANKVTGIIQHSKGGLTGTVVDTRLILAPALLSLSCNIIVAHNHPSGNTQPSDADIKVTKKLNEAAKLMEIKLIDHIILTKDSYFSFADEGII